MIHLQSQMDSLAFVIGVDFANVRFVIPSARPDDTESYIQETVRAGRDHKHAEAPEIRGLVNM